MNCGFSRRGDLVSKLGHCLGLLSLAVTFVRPARAGSELEQHLRNQYQDKTLVLRNFYHSGRLTYDSAGSLTGGSAVSGDWTADGFVRVTSLDLHGKRLTIMTRRLYVGNTGQTFQFEQYFDKNKKKNRDEEEKAESEHRLRIDVEFDGEITSENADAVISRIFLTAHDRFADLMPDYWKPCVLAASTGKGAKQYKACNFPREFAAIPGVVYTPDETAKSNSEEASGETNSAEGPRFRLGKGVSPPRVIDQRNPEFTEPARSAKYQGAVVLSLVVDKMGQVRNIRVLNPLGFGLDQKAVETVSKWQFDPAMKDGDPVDVEIAVEVSFHLY